MRLFGLPFLLQALVLHIEEARVIAFMRNAAAAIELENPARHIVEEVAIMGDEHDGALELAQRVFEPGHGFGVEMVGRFVEQQNVGRFEQEPAERHAALLAAGELRHIGIGLGATQRIHRHLDLGIEIPKALRLDLVLQPRHFVGGFVGVIRRDLVVAVEQRFLGRHARHDIAQHIERGIELRLLRQIADAHAVRRPGLAGDIPCRCPP